MIRFGIHLPEDLTLRRTSGFWGKRRPVAITLYPVVARYAGPDRDPLLERILLRFPTPTGAFKRTYANRHPAFDQQVVQLIRERFRPGGSYHVHDMGVSDGCTSIDFFHALSDVETHEFSLLATDYAPAVTTVSAPGSRLIAVIDPDTLEPLQVILPPLVLNAKKKDSIVFFPLNRLILAALTGTSVRTLLSRLAAGDAGLRVDEIQLLHPRFVELETRCSQVRFRRYDLLEPIAERFHVVRAMNVLNRAYFTSADLRTALGHVHESLHPDGIFVVGSNEGRESRVNGSAFQKVPGGFETVHGSNAGSEIAELVNQFRT